MDLLDYGSRLEPYQAMLAAPLSDAPAYVRQQYARWEPDAERYILGDGDVSALLRPHCMRRLTAMAAVFLSLAKEK